MSIFALILILAAAGFIVFYVGPLIFGALMWVIAFICIAIGEGFKAITGRR